MKKLVKRGFTMVEVMLFLAITGIILVSVIISTRNAVNEQRYNDSIQNFAEFLRSVYSSVSNPKGKTGGLGGGKGETALYGKLVTFGEDKQYNPDNKIYVYDVIGDAKVVTGDTISALKAVKADAVIRNGSTTALTGGKADYRPNWDAKLENPNGTVYKGAILIARSPASGTIYTYVMEGSTLEISELLSRNITPSATKPSLQLALEAGKFTQKEISFCVIPEGLFVFGGVRHREVRIASGAHDASAIVLSSMDGEDNKCK